MMQSLKYFKSTSYFYYFTFCVIVPNAFQFSYSQIMAGFLRTILFSGAAHLEGGVQCSLKEIQYTSFGVQALTNTSPNALREKSPYSEFFWFAFSCIRNEYEDGVCLRVQSECGKIRTRKTPNTNTFHAVMICDNIFVVPRSALQKCFTRFSYFIDISI